MEFTDHMNGEVNYHAGVDILILFSTVKTHYKVIIGIYFKCHVSRLTTGLAMLKTLRI